MSMADSKCKKARLEVAANAILSGDMKILHGILNDPNCPEDPQEWLGAIGVGEDQDGWTVLHLAAMHDQVACIESLLEKFPKLATTTAERQEKTPLLLAVEKEKDLSTIQALIKGNGKVAINFVSKCYFSATPLWFAFRAKQSEKYAYNLTKLLLDNGATYTKDLKGAICGGHLSVVKLMMERGCKASTHFNNDSFPLYLAAKEGHLPIVKLLLKHVPSMVKTRTSEGETALMAAAGAGYADCVVELISAGANPNAMDEDGACILLTAASRGNHEVVKVLLKQKSVRATAAKMSDWCSELHPLTNAVASGSAETVRLLANSKFYRSDLHSDDEEAMNANVIDEFFIPWGSLGLMSWALNSMCKEVEEIVNVLCDAGFPVDETSRSSVPPLTVAVMQMSDDSKKMERIIRRLMEENADLNFVSSSSSSKKKVIDVAPDAFVAAIQVDCEEALHLLIQYWKRIPAKLLVSYDNHDDVSPLNLQKWTPILLKYGIRHGHPFVKKLEKKLQKAMREDPSKVTTQSQTDKTKEPTVNRKELFSGFLETLKCPSSLQQLARFTLREKMGKIATKEQETLPSVLKKLKNIPKDIMSFLLMEKP